MARYFDLIRRHAAEKNRLHKALHDAYHHYVKTQSGKDEWHRAARDFRSFRSSMDSWLDDISAAETCDWEDGREFVFGYFAVDPIYFRSGYVKEKLIRKVKGIEFTKDEAEILRELILRRVRNGAFREFKAFCRLIPRIQTETFAEELRELSKDAHQDIAGRAKFAAAFLASG